MIISSQTGEHNFFLQQGYELNYSSVVSCKPVYVLTVPGFRLTSVRCHPAGESLVLVHCDRLYLQTNV